MNARCIPRATSFLSLSESSWLTTSFNLRSAADAVRAAALAQKAGRRAEQERARRLRDDAIATARGRPELSQPRSPPASPPTEGGDIGGRRRRRGGRIPNLAGLGSSQAAYEAWLDEHDARVPLTRSDLRSPADDAAEQAVAAGGGVEAVIEATGLRTRENVLNLIDPAILERAQHNDNALTGADSD